MSRWIVLPTPKKSPKVSVSDWEKKEGLYGEEWEDQGAIEHDFSYMCSFSGFGLVGMRGRQMCEERWWRWMLNCNTCIATDGMNRAQASIDSIQGLPRQGIYKR